MKKGIIFTLAIIFASVLNAQVFIGGSVGFEKSSGSYTNYAEPKTTYDGSSVTRFSFSPMMGYSINEKIAVGLELSASSSRINPANDPLVVYRKSTNLGINPFVRYYFLKLSKFFVYNQLNLSVYNYFGETKTNTITAQEPSTLTLGVGIFPALQYELNNRIGLFSTLNFLNIGYYYTRTQQGEASEKIVSNGHSFTFGIDSNNVTKVDNLQIGFYIKL